MKITTMIENSLGENKELINEHGLSFFIEMNEGNIIFDTGQSGDFIKNASKLGIDLRKTNYLVLSHAHYDHCGGVRKFINSVDGEKEMYISSNFFKNSGKYRFLGEEETGKFNKKDYKYRGIDFDEEFIKDKNVHINYVDCDSIKINKKVYIFTNFKRKYDFEKVNPNMKLKLGEKMVTDEFKDEITMAIDTSKGIVILLGCSHPGVLNIIDTIEGKLKKNIYAVLGGTHLVEADEERINKTIEVLKKKNIKLIGVSHCTGDMAIGMLKENFDNFFINSTGTSIEIE